MIEVYKAKGSYIYDFDNNRYLDFCFFRTNNDVYFYEQKRFPKHFYNEIITINVNDFTYSVPKKYKEICKYSYNI